MKRNHKKSNPAPKSPKDSALLAWKVVVDNNRRSGRKLTPLLQSIGRALHRLTGTNTTFRDHHLMGVFARNNIASSDQAKHVSIPALEYSDGWCGKWYVSNFDLNFISDVRMWYHRYQDDDPADLLGSVKRALCTKRMQQAYDRYTQTGLREEHCKLAARAGWEVDTSRGDWVSIFVQGKRPLGDSSRARSFWDAVGWEVTWNMEADEGMPEDCQEKAWNLFDELPFALPDMAKIAEKKARKH